MICTTCNKRRAMPSRDSCSLCLREAIEGERGIGSAVHIRLEHHPVDYTEKMLPEFDDL
ncbi:MAG: hypothetical protein R8K20_11310 [Gallionellaceae bacterium]